MICLRYQSTIGPVPNTINSVASPEVVILPIIPVTRPVIPQTKSVMIRPYLNGIFPPVLSSMIGARASYGATPRSQSMYNAQPKHSIRIPAISRITRMKILDATAEAVNHNSEKKMPKY